MTLIIIIYVNNAVFYDVGSAINCWISQSSKEKQKTTYIDMLALLQEEYASY